MATITVDQAKLVLNSFAAIFQNNLVSSDLVTWKKFDAEMNDRNGLTVVEQVVPDYTTTFTTNAVNDLTSGVQDTTFGSEQFKLTQVVGSSMGWADFVKIRDIGAARESEALKAAALRLATDIDAYILGFAAKASNNLLGNGSSDVATWDNIASGYTRLKEEGVDDDSMLRAVLTYGDKQALGSDIVSDNSALTGGPAEGIYRKGFTGTIAGIPTMFTQQLPSVTVGTRLQTSALTAGTADSGTAYEDVAISGAPGQFKSQILNMDIGAGSETLVDGEVFTIDGVYAYDNRAKKALDHLQQFRVIGNYTAATGAVAPRVYPALITSGPYQTIAAAPANTANVNFVGAPSAVLKPRFIANKSAVVVNTADLIMPATGTSMRKALTKVPLSVRMWQHSDFATGAHSIRFDVALEANVTADGRRRLVRINGGA
jgi:hypothetical protein